MLKAVFNVICLFFSPQHYGPVSTSPTGSHHQWLHHSSATWPSPQPLQLPPNTFDISHILILTFLTVPPLHIGYSDPTDVDCVPLAEHFLDAIKTILSINSYTWLVSGVNSQGEIWSCIIRHREGCKVCSQSKRPSAKTWKTDVKSTLADR